MVALSSFRLASGPSSIVTQPLLHRVAAGDRNAVQEVIDRYGGLVWSLARRFNSSHADAEDAAQEVFVELWTKAARYDPAIASETTFVSLIARRRLIDRGRRKARQLEGLELSETLVNPSGGRELEEVELGDEAARAALAFEKLRPEQQQVLRLSIYDGMSHDEIARATKLPLGTVKTHVRRGLAKVRELLGAANPARAEGGEA